ncbi:MAG: hypothetical protein L0H69_03510 [Brevibacterium sp.]|nr:hypothetical protein [Brevibacterium sp.]
MDPTWIQDGLTVAEDHHGVGRVCEAIKGCELPVAVALHGYCIGGAAEIAAAADFRVGGTGP